MIGGIRCFGPSFLTVLDIDWFFFLRCLLVFYYIRFFTEVDGDVNLQGCMEVKNEHNFVLKSVFCKTNFHSFKQKFVVHRLRSYHLRS